MFFHNANVFLKKKYLSQSRRDDTLLTVRFSVRIGCNSLATVPQGRHIYTVQVSSLRDCDERVTAYPYRKRYG